MYVLRVEALIRLGGKLVVAQEPGSSWRLPGGVANLAAPLDAQAAEIAVRLAGLPIKIDSLAYVYTAAETGGHILGLVFRGQALARSPGRSWQNGDTTLRLLTYEELPELDHPLLDTLRSDWHVSFARPAAYIAAGASPHETGQLSNGTR